jgi:SecD/SecF fusion protein
MLNLRRNALILLVIFVGAIWAIYPPSKKIRLGKDVAGGVSLVYGVDVKAGDSSDILGQVATNIKQRLDPGGALELSVQPMGSDRLEITMPLPNDRVNGLKKDFEKELATVGTASMTREELERIATMPEPQRGDAIKAAAGADKDRLDKLNRAVLDFDSKTKARAEYDPAAQNVKFIRDRIRDAGGEGSQDPIVPGLKDSLKAAEEKASPLLRTAAGAETAYEASLKAAVSAGLNSAELRRALTLSDKPFKLLDKDGKVAVLDSPRQRAVTEIKEQFPSQKDAIDRVIKKWNAFESERTGLDDPQDVTRILKGAGVLNFRIAVRPGDLSGENELRDQLRLGGPRAVKSEDAHFYKVNKIEQWVESVDQLESLKKSPAAFFAGRRLVAEEYKGSYYILCWDKRGMRLTQDDGKWSLAKAYQGADNLGRSAIDFEMDILGGDKLGRLTGPNKGQAMAVLLDDEVYTAPTLQSEISNRGQITGNFQQTEVDYIIRVLSAGSLKAKLSQEPLSSSIVGPSLGADNLHKSFETGVVAFVLVAGFMIVYYFTSGFIAVIALVFNCLLVIAMMALNQSAFTLPGIAGVVLTFGQAVDANVLIYERMREEMQLGHDLRTSVRLGFSRALSPIVDGNISNLIICVVLGFFGTEEIRGFAVTLGIGVVTTLFTTLFFTRWVFNVLIERFGWRNTSQLPMSVPAVQRIFSPHIDWMKHRWGHLGLLIAFLAVSAVIVVYQGKDLLGMEFRSGTAVTLTLKQTTGADGKPVQVKLRREDVEAAVKEIAKAAPPGDVLSSFAEAQVIAVNPDADNVTSGTFTVKSLVTDPKVVHDALVSKFIDKLDVRQALSFSGSAATSVERAPVFPITSTRVADVLEKPGQAGTIPPEFVGGVAILLEKISPPVSADELHKRLEATRQKSEFADIGARPWNVQVLEGSNTAASSAVIFVRDPEVNFDVRKRWEAEMRDREWALATSALAQSETLASVQSFSPAIARTFATQGIVCAALSLMGLTIYVFVRFGTLRWAVAATLPLFADVIGIIGLLGVAQILYTNPSTQAFAAKLGLLPFDLDLAQIAAVLTIVGYSLNDKIIILDRIRENKGKLPYASAKVINDSINQTLSRTVITAGAHMITTIALYIFGGEAVRGFAFTFNLGVLLGTYTSIVSTPLVWSRKSEQSLAPAAGARSSSSGAQVAGGYLAGSNGSGASGGRPSHGSGPTTPIAGGKP